MYTAPHRLQSGEERHCVLVGIDKNWQRKNCLQADTEHMCPLLVAWPYMNNSRLPKQPPLKLPNLAWVLSHVFSDPLKLVKRGKEGVSENGRSKWWNQNSDSNVMVDLLQISRQGMKKTKNLAQCELKSNKHEILCFHTADAQPCSAFWRSPIPSSSKGEKYIRNRSVIWIKWLLWLKKKMCISKL